MDRKQSWTLATLLVNLLALVWALKMLPWKKVLDRKWNWNQMQRLVLIITLILVSQQLSLCVDSILQLTESEYASNLLISPVIKYCSSPLFICHLLVNYVYLVTKYRSLRMPKKGGLEDQLLFYSLYIIAPTISAGAVLVVLLTDTLPALDTPWPYLRLLCVCIYLFVLFNMFFLVEWNVVIRILGAYKEKSQNCKAKDNQYWNNQKKKFSRAIKLHVLMLSFFATIAAVLLVICGEILYRPFMSLCYSMGMSIGVFTTFISINLATVLMNAIQGMQLAVMDTFTSVQGERTASPSLGESGIQSTHSQTQT